MEHPPCVTLLPSGSTHLLSFASPPARGKYTTINGEHNFRQLNPDKIILFCGRNNRAGTAEDPRRITTACARAQTLRGPPRAGGLFIKNIFFFLGRLLLRPALDLTKHRVRGQTRVSRFSACYVRQMRLKINTRRSAHAENMPARHAINHIYITSQVLYLVPAEPFDVYTKQQAPVFLYSRAIIRVQVQFTVHLCIPRANYADLRRHYGGDVTRFYT